MLDKPPRTVSLDNKLFNDDFVLVPPSLARRRSNTTKLILILPILFVLLVVLRFVFWFVAGR
jgi:hypothetical protein